MSVRFPYNLPSRAALCRLIRETSAHKDITDDLVTFEDMYHSPTSLVPGRTFLEMVDKRNQRKSWFVYRRLSLELALGKDIDIVLTTVPTPKSIAEEINRSRNMNFGADDISFSSVPLEPIGGEFRYKLTAMLGSYAYYGSCNVTVTVSAKPGVIRLLEDGTPRILENGESRELESWL